MPSRLLRLMFNSPAPALYKCYKNKTKSLHLEFSSLWPISIWHQGLITLIKTYQKSPDEVFKFKNLKKLYLRGNRITSLPPQIANLDQLELLDLSNNNIADLRAKVFDLKNLKTLVINNKIKKTP